jgi:hypothetical protein
MLLSQLAHRIILISQAREAAAFRRGMPFAATQQKELLKEYVFRNRNTAFGCQYGFGEIRNYSEFVQRIPILDYDMHKPFIERIAAGESDILHSGRTLFFEETSGSSGSPKLIPYNHDLRGEFQKGLSSWMDALSHEFPGVFKGKFYWSLSPVLRTPRHTLGGLSIGAVGDTGYFNPLKRPLLRAILAVPESLQAIRDAEEFYRATWVSLLTVPSLTFLSCWSPLFFLQLDQFLCREKESIAAMVRGKGIHNRTIARRLEILKDSFTWSELWPELACVSCWTHGASAPWMDTLQARLGSVPVQGKGLLSTECFVSFPWEKERDPILAYRSHFFEFREIEADITGEVVPMEGLRLGGTYEVLVTTGGGLCRYPTGDMVQVTSKIFEVPCLHFLGRRTGWTDMAGEKISEGAAVAALQSIRKECGVDILGGALVACANPGSRPRYCLHLEWREKSEDFDAQARLALAMEEQLGENPYYKQARALGQLESLKVEVLNCGDMERFLTSYRRKYQVADGNVKLPFLFQQKEWNQLREDYAIRY